MRKISFVMIMAFVVLAFAGWAQAEDKLLSATIASVTQATDKKGNEYTRIIVNEKREVGGVAYDRGIPVMAFREMNDQAKAMGLKEGDQLKAVVQHSVLKDGRESYRIMAFQK